MQVVGKAVEGLDLVVDQLVLATEVGKGSLKYRIYAGNYNSSAICS